MWSCLQQYRDKLNFRWRKCDLYTVCLNPRWSTWKCSQRLVSYIMQLHLMPRRESWRRAVIIADERYYNRNFVLSDVTYATHCSDARHFDPFFYSFSTAFAHRKQEWCKSTLWTFVISLTVWVKSDWRLYWRRGLLSYERRSALLIRLREKDLLLLARHSYAIRHIIPSVYHFKCLHSVRSRHYCEQVR